MKKYLLAIATLLVIIACEKEIKTPVDYVLFSGKIENPTEEEIIVYQRNGYDKLKEIPLQKDGSFSDTLKIASGYYRIYNGEVGSTFHLAPTDEINLSFDAKNISETIAVSGTGVEKNNYLIDKNLKTEKIATFELYKNKEAEFLNLINKEKATHEEVLKNAKNLPDAFIALEKKNIYYYYLDALSRYPLYHTHLGGNLDYTPSQGFLAPLDTLDYDNEDDFINFQDYRGLTLNHYIKKMNSEDPKNVFITAENIAILNALKSQIIKNAVAERFAVYVQPGNKSADKLYDFVHEISNEEAFKKRITEKFNTMKNLIAGKDSPTFDYENHKGGKTSLADLQGKYVYVDVWATWCGPCIAEIPSLKKVEKQYHNKNVEFVSISIDEKKDYEKWKQMVNEKELGGVQLIADNAWKSQFVTDYAIQSIPRFILIGPDGTIVNADAPRPSSEKLIELFNELKI